MDEAKEKNWGGEKGSHHLADAGRKTVLKEEGGKKRKKATLGFHGCRSGGRLQKQANMWIGGKRGRKEWRKSKTVWEQDQHNTDGIN